MPSASGATGPAGAGAMGTRPIPSIEPSLPSSPESDSKPLGVETGSGSGAGSGNSGAGSGISGCGSGKAARTCLENRIAIRSRYKRVKERRIFVVPDAEDCFR